MSWGRILVQNHFHRIKNIWNLLCFVNNYCFTLIPGVSDTKENLAAIRAIVGSNPWEALPYNPLAKKKHERLGLSYPDFR